MSFFTHSEKKAKTLPALLKPTFRGVVGDILHLSTPLLYPRQVWNIPLYPGQVWIYTPVSRVGLYISKPTQDTEVYIYKHSPSLYPGQVWIYIPLYPGQVQIYVLCILIRFGYIPLYPGQVWIYIPLYPGQVCIYIPLYPGQVCIYIPLYPGFETL